MSGYVKLFASILDSTVWQESKETRLVWITMLAMKNRYQVVESSVPGLAKRAGVTVEECESALKKLISPDPYSRTQEHEGRRIEAVDGGWTILNGQKYRDKMTVSERRIYKADWMANYRKKQKQVKNVPTQAERLEEKQAKES